jgi:hypothetical protein
MRLEKVVRHQPGNVPAVADRDVGLEWNPACDFIAHVRSAYWLPDHEGTRRADVDGIEVLQLVRKHTWSERPMTADVDASKKNDECQAMLTLC